MSSFGATELLIVLVIVLLILGPKRLPALGRQLGGGIREFRKSIGGGSDSDPDDEAVRRRKTPASGTPADPRASGARPETVDADGVPDRPTP